MWGLDRLSGEYLLDNWVWNGRVQRWTTMDCEAWTMNRCPDCCCCEGEPHSPACKIAQAIQQDEHLRQA